MTDQNFPAITPYLAIKDAAAAIAFYEKAFGATVAMRLNWPGSETVCHATLTVQGGAVMVAEDMPQFAGGKSRAPSEVGVTSVGVHIHVASVDAANALWDQAVAAGCAVLMPIMDQFWGDRYGKLRDPFGHEWSIGTTIATPTIAEMEAALRAFMENPQPCGNEG